jgi:hypothetical protein
MLAMAPLSHAGDSATETAWVMARCCCQVTLVMALPSYAGDGVAEVTWPWHDVDAEPCWRRRCQVMLAMVLQR